VLVDHNAFRELDRSRLAGAVICDTRGIWSEPAGLLGKPLLSVELQSRIAAA
jgi:UDP-N-acetyl-D-mannosaminuronate dehydrogenase